MLARRSSRRVRGARPLASLRVLSALSAGCLHSPSLLPPGYPFTDPVSERLRVAVFVLPRIPGAMIDLGRCSPSWGRIASKISPGCCRDRINRTFVGRLLGAGRVQDLPGALVRRNFAGRQVRPAVQRAAEFRAFRSRGLGVEVWIYRPTEAATARSTPSEPTFRVGALRMPDMGGFGPRLAVAPIA